MQYREPELLTAEHHVTGFSCGKESLDQWIRGRAKRNQTEGTSRTWVVLGDEGSIAGYYSSATGALLKTTATAKASQGQPDEIPAILLGRFAVAEKHQRRGLGQALLKHFIMKGLEVSDIVGVRLLLVHAMDQDAREFYLHFDFEPSPIDDLTLMLLLKDVRESLGHGA